MFDIKKITKNIFSKPNKKKYKAYEERVEKINLLEDSFIKLSKEELRAKTTEFREKIKSGVQQESLLVEAFATVREAAKRTLGQRHYDVQLIGGMVLNDGGISEMKTGEGKTLVSTLPVYLNALSDLGVHIITVNDYLAQRDAKWMGQIFQFLGLTVGCLQNNMSDDDRKYAYQADITYGTNNEFGFDYLRDNMKHDFASMVQRDHHFAIIDEVDSILIDEARTPLVISGPSEVKSDMYTSINKLMPQLKDDDFEIDEKTKSINLSDNGIENAEEILKKNGVLIGQSLFDIENISIIHHINQAARAHRLFIKNKDYIVKDKKVIIIDEFTGRMMEGRRYSDGLHQALEAKENCIIQSENQTLASVTFQNYFRLYKKLGGMTGTASTEAEELMDIYSLPVLDIPTNKPISRLDENDEIYMTLDEKYHAIVEEIKECYKKKQPVLVGTTSIERSEFLASLLEKAGFKRNNYLDKEDIKIKPNTFAVLNAKYHIQEARIIEQAGRLGAITIATNMAGRGTDIQLGGNLEAEIRIIEEMDSRNKSEQIVSIKADIEKEKKEVISAGGLYVLGTERHESRRIDNQLRGRAGRQGDPGKSKFYISLQDELMRIFGTENMDSMLKKLGLKDGEPIIHPWINKALEKAQSKIESRNFDIRKSILQFDDVMNDQRKVIFEQRKDLMDDTEASETIIDMRYEYVEDLVQEYIPENSYPEQWDTQLLRSKIKTTLLIDIPVDDWAEEEGIAEEEIITRIKNIIDQIMELKEKKYGADVLRKVEKSVLLQVLDLLWREHLSRLEHLRSSVTLRSYGQRDPLNEYKTESFELFQSLLTKLREQVTAHLIRVEVVKKDQLSAENNETVAKNNKNPTNENQINPKTVEEWGKVGRNELCPCGSGKKYKHCHGKMN
ncbi:MAG: preprotein translocase subunit SecA [Alphaproteobacteria bacterium]|mgnify:FL=1|nr:preprotein translocase subunit SecA [Rhodobiaceae bacterium]OUT75124.1 MAG: preprotein translocase subunit SecA [Rhizobiales bacterium TMED25]|tara:strand:- start:8961 stop:11660 length:2700 start_codon:yes stop_codon:yes gene_type:complete